MYEDKCATRRKRQRHSITTQCKKHDMPKSKTKPTMNSQTPANDVSQSLLPDQHTGHTGHMAQFASNARLCT